MSFAPDPIDRTNPRGLSHELVQQLTDMIQSGKFRRGDKLPTEATLMDGFKVSRTVVREAISHLQAAGLVETQQGRGSFVLNAPTPGSFSIDAAGLQSPDAFADIVDLRIGIEGEAAALAASRRTIGQLKELQRRLEEFRTSQRPNDAMEADFKFHLAIASASQNPHFRNLLKSLGPMSIIMPTERIVSSGPAPSSEHLQLAWVEHSNILAAIEQQDPELARAAIRVHLSNSRTRLSPHLSHARE